MTGSFLLIRSILGSLRESLEISAFFNEIKTPFFELAKPFLSLNSTNFDDFIHQLKILRIWVETFRNFVIKFSDLKSNAWENLISNENIGSFLFEILRLSPPLNKQEENLLFCTSNSQKLNILLNELKSKTLKALNLIFELGINEGQRGFSFGIIQMSPFYIDLIYRSLIRTLTPSELNESSSFYLWEKTKEGLMIQALSFMKKACFLPQNNNFYQMNHHR